MTTTEHSTITYSKANLLKTLKEIEDEGWEVEEADLVFSPFEVGNPWKFSSYRGNEDATSYGDTADECLDRFLRGEWDAHGFFMGGK